MRSQSDYLRLFININVISHRRVIVRHTCMWECLYRSKIFHLNTALYADKDDVLTSLERDDVRESKAHVTICFTDKMFPLNAYICSSVSTITNVSVNKVNTDSVE